MPGNTDLTAAEVELLSQERREHRLKARLGDDTEPQPGWLSPPWGQSRHGGASLSTPYAGSQCSTLWGRPSTWGMLEGAPVMERLGGAR